MRKVIVLEHISLDGVIQARGGPDEDTSGGFAYGGWIAPYSDVILTESNVTPNGVIVVNYERAGAIATGS